MDFSVALYDDRESIDEPVLTSAAPPNRNVYTVPVNTWLLKYTSATVFRMTLGRTHIFTRKDRAGFMISDSSEFQRADARDY